MEVNSNTDFFENKNNFISLGEVPVRKIYESINHGKYSYTIAIPTFGRSDLLQVAMESAINQVNFNDYEIIVLDNEPDLNDETHSLMVNYSSYNNISYYKNFKNIGMTANWNRLFQLSLSPWTLMFHSDDILGEDFMSTMVRAVNQIQGCDILLCNRILWRKGQQPKITINSSNINCLKLTLNYLFNSYRGLAPSGCFFRTKSFLASGGFNNEFYPSQDYIFMSKMTTNYNVYFLDMPIFIYRVFDNLTSNVKIQKKHIILDYYFQNYLGNILNYNKHFIGFITLKNALYRYLIIKRIEADYEFPQKHLKKYSLFYYLFKFYDIVERVVVKNKLKKIRISYVEE